MQDECGGVTVQVKDDYTLGWDGGRSDEKYSGGQMDKLWNKVLVCYGQKDTTLEDGVRDESQDLGLCKWEVR